LLGRISTNFIISHEHSVFHAGKLNSEGDALMQQEEGTWRRVGVGVRVAAAAASLALAVAIGRSSDGRLWERVRGSRTWSLAQARTRGTGGGAAGALARADASGRGAHAGGPAGETTHTSPASNRLALPALSAAGVGADPVQSLRQCLLDKRQASTYEVASLVSKSKQFADCWQDECDNADMQPEDCRLTVEAFSECWQPFNGVSIDTLIEAEACTQRLQSLSVDKYIQKYAPAFS
jgi:hypothetical protein